MCQGKSHSTGIYCRVLLHWEIYYKTDHAPESDLQFWCNEWSLKTGSTAVYFIYSSSAVYRYSKWCIHTYLICKKFMWLINLWIRCLSRVSEACIGCFFRVCELNVWLFCGLCFKLYCWSVLRLQHKFLYQLWSWILVSTHVFISVSVICTSLNYEVTK